MDGSWISLIVFVFLYTASPAYGNGVLRFYTYENSNRTIDGTLKQVLSVRGVNETGGVVGSNSTRKAFGNLRAFGDPPVPKNESIIYSSSGSNYIEVNTNGTVYAKQDFDRESVESSDLRVTFFARYRSYTSAEVAVEIIVLDINDNFPVFDHRDVTNTAGFGTKISEFTPVGSLIFDDMIVWDKDQAYHSLMEITCGVDDGKAQSILACDTFRVEAKQDVNFTGDGSRYYVSFYTKINLNYEENPSYVLVVNATDNPNKLGTGVQRVSVINFVIKIQDEQDTRPVFSAVSQTMFVHEHSKLGKRIGEFSVQDGDLGTTRELQIEIIDPQGLFSLTISKGFNNLYNVTIVVADNIDRETYPSHSFKVKATELFPNGSLTDQSSTVNVEIAVRDINDNSPKFDKDVYNINVTETDSNGTVPGLFFEVTDADLSATSGQFASFTVQIVDQSFPSVFKLDLTNGTKKSQFSLNIQQPQYLDYEIPSFRKQFVKLLAMDIDENSLTSTAVININILDANDHFPIFEKDSYSQRVSENIPVNSFIIQVKATDQDSGENGRIIYRLEGANKDVFNIDPNNGRITLAKPLDFEALSGYVITVFATDHGPSPKSTNVQLTVAVINYNDVGPAFELQIYRTSVNESSTKFLIPITVKANDREGNAVSYEIVSGNTIDNKFNLHKDTGKLTLTQKVNYIETPLDTSDPNVPVNERRPSGKFTLKIRATDNGNPPLSSNATIEVSVIDENNLSPVFDRSSYVETISELQKIGNTVSTVSATDGDFGSNGDIRYFIFAGAQDDFLVETKTGHVIVSGGSSLDYDAHPFYNITIYAIDEGSPPRSGSTSVLITLTDANNKDPTFPQQNYVKNINEAETIGTVVTKVEASDQDSTSQLQYSIRKSSVKARDPNGGIVTSFQFDFQSTFKIDATSGVITTNKTLDYDTASLFEFIVEAKDLKAEFPLIQTATVTVIVYVLESKDPTPVFALPWTKEQPVYTQQIPEEKPIGYRIMTLIATNPVTNAQVENYQMIPGSNGDSFFAVNRTTGAITVVKNMDYERLLSKTLYFSVRATSAEGLTVTVNITFNIKNINDNAPLFSQSIYIFNVTEDISFPDIIGSVYATDADNASNADLFFSLSGTDSHKFVIFPRGGISVNESVVLDYEDKKSYYLLVKARDSPGTGSFEAYKETSVQLRINLIDINDNSPKFLSDRYDFFTVETFSSQFRIGEVTALDHDSGNNGRVTYIFINGSQYGLQYFAINEQTGTVYSKIPLDGASTHSPYRLTVRAADSGIPPRTSQVYVYLNVSSGQLDNGQPVWLTPGIDAKVSLNENVPVKTSVFNASASARTPGAIILFSFLSNFQYHDKFAITPEGHITVVGNLDREIKDVYDLIILATDSLNRTLQGTRRLTVELIDVNDNIPSFKDCPDRTYSEVELANVREGAPRDTFVYQVKACDKDLSPNNRIQYRLHEDEVTCFLNVSQYFRLDESTGKIYTKIVLDREVRPLYRVCVKAEERVNGRRRRRAADETVLKVNITILDVNDHGPTFLTRDVYRVIFDRPQGRNVTQLIAFDPDSLTYNGIRYSITDIHFRSKNGKRSFKAWGAFTIIPEKGLLSLSFNIYSAFREGEFTISVKAEDTKNSNLYDETKVTVYVAEELFQVRLVTQGDADVSASVIKMLHEIEDKNPSLKIQQTLIRYHKDANGGTVTTKTDVCMLIVRDNSVLDAYDGTEILKQQSSIVSKYGFTDAGPCEPTTSQDLEGWADFWWVLVAFAIFMFILILICIYAICIFYRNYRVFMKTQQQYLEPQ